MLWDLIKLSKLLRQKYNIQHPFHSLYSFWTPLFLALTHLLIIGKEYFGKPIVCLGIHGFDREYIEARCWGLGTHTLKVYEDYHMDLGLGQSQSNKEIFTQDFYNYMWLVVGGICVLFVCPHKLWKYLEAGRVQSLCMGLKPKDDPQKIQLQTNLCKTLKMLMDKEFGDSYYLYKYFGCGAWSVLNPLLSFILIDLSLSKKFRFLGVEIFKSRYAGFEINDFDQAFPLQAKCFLNIYGPTGSPQIFDTICQLPINNVNRAVFPVIWYGLLILLVIGVLFLALEMRANLDTRYAGKARIPKTSIDEDDYILRLQRCKPVTLFLLKQIERNVDSETYDEVFKLFILAIAFKAPTLSAEESGAL